MIKLFVLLTTGLVFAYIRGDDVSIKHSARFDTPLFAAPVTKLACEFSPLTVFADRALVAIVVSIVVGGRGKF